MSKLNFVLGWIPTGMGLIGVLIVAGMAGIIGGFMALAWEEE